MKTRRLVLASFVAVLIALLVAPPVYAQFAPIWTEPDGQGGANVHLYVFHSRTCPHCLEAMPFIEEMAAANPWIELHSMEVTESKENATRYVEFASALGQEAMYVPAFFHCGVMTSGYDNEAGVGAQLRDSLIACHEDALAALGLGGGKAAASAASGDEVVAAAPPVAQAQAAADETISVPLVGAVSVSALSLPALTVTIAALDAFNPCAFFVLMFLLSLMVHAGSRRRMLLVGGVFVLFSGLVYFVFMSAWLNVFLWLGELQFITLLAGIVAIALALINIKDFFWFKQGISLSIPDSAKPGIFARARGTVSADSLPAVLGSTVLLALAANSYELLCTSGFPMVYTRALTLHDLPAGAYYAYLALYNIVYVIPLLVIVALFAARFGARKLSENEGRVLKLVSGVMMLMLGIVLVLAPERLSNPLTALALLAAALGTSFVLVYYDRSHRPAKSTQGDGRGPASKHKGARGAHR